MDLDQFEIDVRQAVATGQMPLADGIQMIEEAVQAHTTFIQTSMMLAALLPREEVPVGT